MHEREKIEEAKYFYLRMIEVYEDREQFRYNLSAFLSAARSVLQYAERESDPGENPKAVPGAKAWYDNFVANSSVLKFFKCKRNVNIHVEPVKPRADFLIKVTEPISVIFSGSDVTLEHRDKNGKLISQSTSKEPKSKPKPKKSTGSAESKTTFWFNDWTGNEDVITLCERYIQELEKVVKDGVSKGYITG